MSTRVPETREVVVTKTAKGFGFSIFGGDASYVSDNGVSTSFTPICISNLVDGGGAQQTGQISVGDQVLCINGEPSEGISHPDAVKLLMKCGSEITLVLGSLAIHRGPQESASSLSGKTLLATVEYERVEIIYPFAGNGADELALDQGDEVHVVGKGKDGWCRGICVRTQKTGMFPGNYAVRMQHEQEVLDSLYQELEQLNPGLVSDGRNEVLYEELPDPLLNETAEPTGNRSHDSAGYKKLRASNKKAPKAARAGEVVYQRVGSAASSEEGAAPTPPAVPEYAMAGVAPAVQAGEVIYQQLPEGADAPIAPVIEDVYAVATQDEDSAKKPRVRIVASSNGVSGSDIYEPISDLVDAAANENIYNIAGDLAAPIYDLTQDWNGAEVEDLYATVNQSGPKERGTLANLRLPSDESIYASVKRSPGEAPALPVRSYDGALLPPTMHVQVGDSDNQSMLYEKLPADKMYDVDTAEAPALPERRISHVPGGSARTSEVEATGEGAEALESVAEHKGGKLSKEDKKRQKAEEKERKDQEKQRLKDEKKKAKEDKDQEKAKKKQEKAAEKEEKKRLQSQRSPKANRKSKLEAKENST